MSKHDVDFVSTLDYNMQRKISSDQQLGALKKMRDLPITAEERAEIQKFIDQRIAELTREYREG